MQKRIDKERMAWARKALVRLQAKLDEERSLLESRRLRILKAYPGLECPPLKEGERVTLAEIEAALEQFCECKICDNAAGRAVFAKQVIEVCDRLNWGIVKY